jgi:hypothetical protein
VKEISQTTKLSLPPKVNVESKFEDGNLTLAFESKTKQEEGQFEQGLIEALGVADNDLQLHFLQQAIHSVRPTNESAVDGQMNTILALMHEINPRDGIESLLAIQMVNTHHLALEMMRKATLPQQTVDGVDRNVNRAAKLMRIFNSQLDTLQKLRGKGQQKITVEHVNVNEGGQAIVGEVNYLGGGKWQKTEKNPMVSGEGGWKTAIKQEISVKPLDVVQRLEPELPANAQLWLMADVVCMGENQLALEPQKALNVARGQTGNQVTIQ